MAYKLYGIPNCNTVKKARTWLEENNIDYVFHNFKKEGISQEKLSEWMEQYPWDKIMNKAGMTYRKLPDDVKESLTNAEAAIAVLIEKTSMIKRPIIESDQIVTLGFKEEEFQKAYL